MAPKEAPTAALKIGLRKIILIRVPQNPPDTARGGQVDGLVQL